MTRIFKLSPPPCAQLRRPLRRGARMFLMPCLALMLVGCGEGADPAEEALTEPFPDTLQLMATPPIKLTRLATPFEFELIQTWSAGHLEQVTVDLSALAPTLITTGVAGKEVSFDAANPASYQVGNVAFEDGEGWRQQQKLTLECAQVGHLEAQLPATFGATSGSADGTADGTADGSADGTATTALDAWCFDGMRDPWDDLIYGKSSVKASFSAPYIDIIQHSASRVELASEASERLFSEAVLPCGRAETTGPRVYCAAASGESAAVSAPAGPLVVVAQHFGGTIPAADQGHSLVYSVVFETDGNTANDWVARDPIDWDFFQGGDRFYQLTYDHVARAWALEASVVDDKQEITTVSSSVRAVIDGDTIVWFFSEAELGAGKLSYRVTSFGHDGRYGENDSGGDLSGADPTEALLPVP